MITALKNMPPQFSAFTLLLLALTLLLPLTGCVGDDANSGDEYGLILGDDEGGKAVLSPTDWSDPAGKSDALRGRAGLPVSVDSTDTAVWEIKNAWADKDTAAARAAGMAWPANSGLTWEDKYKLWVESMPKISRESYGQTFMLKTPFGFELPAPALECAEVAMFLRITFASWFNLPFFMEGFDGSGNRLYFGHFGVRTAQGNFGNMPRFRASYRDESAKAADFQAGRISWPSDATLAKRKIPGSHDDAQPMIGPTANAGAYFDRIFLNKRVGYFLLLQLTYMGSINLADPVNTYHLKPDTILAGDMLLQRWQRTGIGHALVIMRARRLGTFDLDGVQTAQLEAEVASGSMPRRQPVWESAAASKRSFTAASSGGDANAAFNGGAKRWRAATNINGSWTNVVQAQYTDHWVNSTSLTQIGQRPALYERILTQLSPAQKIGALVEVITARRAHLQSYPSSCSARINRELSFKDLYAVGLEQGKSRVQIDTEHRKLEDYVFAELDYPSSKTCCWNSSTAAMYQLAMDYNRQLLADASGDQCNDIVVFKARADGADGFKLFRDYARSVGKENLWVTWRADETCPQSTTTQDTEAQHNWSPYCSIFANTPVNPVHGDVVSFTSTERVAIPDNNTSGASSFIDLSATGSIKGLTIDLDIRHTYRGDLRVSLRRGTTSVTIFDGPSAGQPSEDDVRLTSEIVNGFNGQRATGRWELHVVDTARADTGSIHTWALNFEL
ncbi:MAG: proprotein convertase P-domain-containing protein [Bradymonadaceae bacterium]|nr:proprotein convertase P-domain-containing protein [Lujinxingiaceae bacterium]